MMADITNGKKLINAEGLLTAATALKNYTDQEAKTLQDQLDVIKGEGEGSIKKAVADLKATHDSEMDDVESRLDDLEGKFEGEQSVASQIEAAKQDALDAVAEEAAKAREEEGKLKTAINTLNGNAQTAGSVAKAVKDAVDAEAEARTQADNDLSGRIAVFEANGAKDVAALTGRVAANEEDIARLDGADTVQGSVKQQIKAVVDAQAPVDAEQNRRLGVLETAIGQGGSLEARVKANEDKLAVVQGADTVEGSIAKAEKDAKAYADQQITALVDSAPDAMNTLNELAKAINDNKGVYDAWVVEHNQAMADMKKDLQDEIDRDVKVVADELAKQKDPAQEGTLAKQIATEKTRAEGQEAAIRREFAAADTALHTTISGETAAAVKVVADDLAEQLKADQEGTLAQKIAAEVTRATGAEKGLQQQITALKGGGEGSVSSQIAAAKQELQSKIDEVAGDLENQMDSAVEGSLQQQIDSLGNAVSAITNGEDGMIESLQSLISTETSLREQGDIALDQRLDVIEGEGAGSVKKALADAKGYADSKDTALRTDMATAFNALDLNWVDGATPKIQIKFNPKVSGYDEVLGDVDVPVMTDAEITEMLNTNLFA